ncbi:DsbA family protein [Sagittula salina]|uniref:DsbA family protein n=1 Tax=Sagittula salina TaxID=2820268 RepID=A0A940S2T9_9RHOB|nr:DsbA family protein [Sagittula salina]MBP0482329.1 DsbA family protein [Sagittula salina]
MNKLLTSGAVALALIAGGALYITQGASTASNGAITLPGAAMAQESEPSKTLPSNEAEAVKPVEIIEMVEGSEDAPITVIEYASYTCPHCASAQANLIPQLKKNYIDTGKVKLIYREVYFDKYGMWGSMLARCGGPEKFFGITDMIYKAQDDILAPARDGNDQGAIEELRKIGRLAGISNEELDSCLNDEPKLRALLTWFQKNATEDNIESTPSFIIDGEKYSNMSYADFSKVLDDKLAE